jgi:hypothetical protein
LGVPTTHGCFSHFEVIVTTRFVASTLMLVALACQELAGSDTRPSDEMSPGARDPEGTSTAEEAGSANGDAARGHGMASGIGRSIANQVGSARPARGEGAATAVGGASNEAPGGAMDDSPDDSRDSSGGTNSEGERAGGSASAADPDDSESTANSGAGGRSGDTDGGTANGGTNETGVTGGAGAGGAPNAGTNAGGMLSSGGTNAGGKGSRCESVVAEHPVTGAQHVATCSPVEYATNPPCEGNHYDDAAAFFVYDEPIPKGFIVHSLEHGGIAIWYNCPKGCPGELARAQAFIDNLPEDVLCVADGIPRRVLLVPDPELSTRWAASAWGWTLNAPCFDEAAFSAFYAAHYDKTHERYCRGIPVTADTCSK